MIKWINEEQSEDGKLKTTIKRSETYEFKKVEEFTYIRVLLN